jgi:16S rRNA (guanine966-N2)-methyltransferase
LVSPGGPTRPMMDRVREALFSVLADRVKGADVIDLYAGSGSLGLEALSRGAGSATFVERDSAALDALRANIDAVGLGGEVVAGTVEDFLKRPGRPYDLAFVDPPYSAPLPSVEKVIEALHERLSPHATVVVHRRAGSGEPDPGPGLAEDWRRRYGDSEISLLKKEER